MQARSLSAVLILIQKMHKTRSVRGISFKTQVLYLAVFSTRYIDLLTGSYYSFYNTVMKVVFLASSGWIVYLMKVKYKLVETRVGTGQCAHIGFRPTQDPAIDTLRLEYLLGPCAVLSLVANYKL